MDLYVQLEHGEELRSITFKGRVRLHVDFNAIGPVVAVEPVDGADPQDLGDRLRLHPSNWRQKLTGPLDAIFRPAPPGLG